MTVADRLRFIKHMEELEKRVQNGDERVKKTEDVYTVFNNDGDELLSIQMKVKGLE